MVKWGICTAAQDVAWRRMWRRGLVSCSLLRAGDPPAKEEIARFERLMKQIQLSNGVSRTTFRGRFSQWNEEIQQCLEQVFPPGPAPLDVADWAVSNGITAIEWFERLRRSYPAVEFTASDRTLYLIEAHLPETAETYILEPGGTPVQYVRDPFVLSLTQPVRWVYWVNRRLWRRAWGNWRNRWSRELQIPRGWSGLEEGGISVEAPPFVLRKLPLVHPEVVHLMTHCRQFHIRRHSIFDALPEPVNVIRTMNIFNRAYFSEDTLTEGARAVWRSLRPGGIWIAGRTVKENPPRHEATIYRRQERGWEIRKRVEGGSETEAAAMRVTG